MEEKNNGKNQSGNKVSQSDAGGKKRAEKAERLANLMELVQKIDGFNNSLQLSKIVLLFADAISFDYSAKYADYVEKAKTHEETINWTKQQQEDVALKATARDVFLAIQSIRK